MSQSLIQQYSELRLPALLPGTTYTPVAAFSFIADLLISYALFFSDYSITLSHNAGFIASGLLLILLHQFSIDKSDITIVGKNRLAKSFSVLGYFIVHSAIRAGCIATLILFSLPEMMALGLGLILANAIGSYSSALLLVRNKLVENDRQSNWIILGIVLTTCVLALRFVFLGAMEVIPQEAYYWNYAQHLSPGYLDHPPMIAASIWFGELLFGHNYFATRIAPFIYGILFILIFYRYARLQVDNKSATFACVLAVLLPYFFLGTGFFATPDAPLLLSWVMALYFFYRALVDGEHTAWYGVGLAMGLGMLSKYSIALLAPAAFAFIIFDSQSRRVLLRKEPYLAVIVSILVFSPVIYWNAVNEWASFAFQGGSRFDEAPKNYLFMMLTNILAIVTPLPLFALPYLFVSKITRDDAPLQSPFSTRIRLFIICFMLIPMAVFAWSALKNEPRYNWTGPLWITILPMLSWLIVHAEHIRWKFISGFFSKVTIPFLFFVICIFSILLQFLTIGLPGLPFPGGGARLLGWPEVAQNIMNIQQQIPAGESKRIVVIGRDKYFITSKLAYHGTPTYLGNNESLEVTGHHLLEDNSLMFAFWNPADKYKGATVIMLGRSIHDLSDKVLKPYFDHLSPAAEAFPVYKDDFGLPNKTIREYYYRIGFGYKPPKYLD